MNKEPTLLEINERIPISKQDYLHLLYRVEELERKVARLKSEKEELPADEQIMEAWGKVPKEVKQAFGYVEEDPFEMMENLPVSLPIQNPETLWPSCKGGDVERLISGLPDNHQFSTDHGVNEDPFIEKFNKQQ